MTTAEETRPLIREGPTVVVQGYSHAGEKPPASELKITLKGVAGIFFAALIVFALAAITSRTILWTDSGSSPDTGMDEASTSGFAAYPVGDPAATPGHGLVNPKNGTRNTLTTTQQCTGDLSYPVLAGADLVAYFSMEEGSKPVIARGDVTSTHRGYLFFFSSVENRDAFESDPYKYLPAWGGFCSYGVAREPVWTTSNLGPFADPSKWKILDDNRLHFFRSDVPMEKFSLAAAEYLKAGEDNWNAWFDGETGPLNTACFCSGTICDDA